MIGEILSPIFLLVGAKPPDAAPEARATVGELETTIRLTWNRVPGATACDLARDRAENGTFDHLVAQVPTNYEDKTATPGLVLQSEGTQPVGGFGPLSEGDPACLPPCAPKPYVALKPRGRRSVYF